jgi:hypothetical protein
MSMASANSREEGHDPQHRHREQVQGAADHDNQRRDYKEHLDDQHYGAQSAPFRVASGFIAGPDSRGVRL